MAYTPSDLWTGRRERSDEAFMRTDAWTSAEDGLTLIELLVSITIFVGVLGVTLTVLSATARGVRKDEVRTDAAVEAQVALGRMVRELRATYQVIDMTATAIDVRAHLPAGDARLRFDCDAPFTPDDPANPYDQDYRRCVRRTAPITDPSLDPPLPSAGTVVLDRICPGSSPTSCASSAAAPVFTCRITPGAAAEPCHRLPDPPIDPDDPPTDGEPIDPVWPTFVEINVEVPARGRTKDAVYGHRISFSDGVLLENLDLQYETAN